ncbi:TPM domain-containing protein, partial [Pseudokineococcus marinus]|uniref:TPM domain-containing protein n=1 Tax=Pseudokineococcus marinus TaxID=351215 RepID=UPI001487775D
MSARRAAASRTARSLPTRTLPAELLAVVLAPLLLLVVGAPSASAVAPLRLDEQVTDQVGALAGDEQQVEQALADLRAETGVQLFVVFVDSFDGLGGQEWAQQTGDISQLGDGDGVLAVATGDRAYGSVVDADVDAPAANAAAEGRLAQDDWAGAVEAYADALASSAGTGGSGTQEADGSGSGGSGGVSGLAVLVVLLLVGVAVAVVVALVRGRREQRSDRARRRGPGTAPAPTPVEPLPDLERRAGSALVAVDDAVMASANEVEFARAEFGDEAVAPFERALAGARADLSAAFAARRRADGEGPDGDRREVDEEERRAALAEVLERCGRADAALDEQTEAFDALRDLGRRAGVVLDARADDVVLDAEAEELPLLEAGVHLHLVERGQDAGVAQQEPQLGDGHVR